MDPRDDDSDDDGVEDGDEGSGTVDSFDAATGKLVISTFGGDSASGLVDDDTEIECDREDGDDDSRDSGPGHDGDGGGDEDEDNSGPGSHGDDEGDEEDCGTEALVEGAVVQEAELEIEDGQATWDEVELLETDPAPAG